MANGILTRDKQKLAIFADPIVVDENLPKYKTISETKEQVNDNTLTTPGGVSGKKLTLDYVTIKKIFEDVSDTDATYLNIAMTERMNQIAQNTKFSREIAWFNSDVPNLEMSNYVTPKKTFLDRLFGLFRKKKEYKEETEDRIAYKNFDVLQFFSDVKLSLDDEKFKYYNRIKEYLNCIALAEVSGQTALKEKLFEKLVVNKYESILYAHGYYKAIDEETVVKFALGSPKAVSLCYIQNYTRNIPIEIIRKKLELDKLQIFDNYCILFYDKDGVAYAKTNKEKEEEVKKAKDPIMFGLLEGSNKLYYVGDWVDKYCDLTLDKICEQIGNDVVEEGFIKENITI